MARTVYRAKYTPRSPTAGTAQKAPVRKLRPGERINTIVTSKGRTRTQLVSPKESATESYNGGTRTVTDTGLVTVRDSRGKMVERYNTSDSEASRFIRQQKEYIH